MNSMKCLSVLLCACPARREWGSKLAFVRPSILSVRRIRHVANNSRTWRPSVPKFGTKVLHLWCDSNASFKVKGQGHTRPINAGTHRPPYLLNGKAYELQTWYTDGWRQPASATGTMTSKVKCQGHKVMRSVWVVLAQCCTCVISGWRAHTVSAEPSGHTSYYY